MTVSLTMLSILKCLLQYTVTPGVVGYPCQSPPVTIGHTFTEP